jgi:hypothetical protein
MRCPVREDWGDLEYDTRWDLACVGANTLMNVGTFTEQIWSILAGEMADDM